MSAQILPAKSSDDITLQNRAIKLTFNSKTGAWVSFIDRYTREELIGGYRQTSIVQANEPPYRISLQTVKIAIQAGKAISLEGNWNYCSDPAEGGEAAGYLKDRFDAGVWQDTPIPSRVGTGDNRLMGRTGDFWYRRSFCCPKEWTGKDIVIVIGAADDFDEAFVNGVKVGATNNSVPNHWKVSRFYHVPARLLKNDRPNTLLVKLNNAGGGGGISGPVAACLSGAIITSSYVAPQLKSHLLSSNANAYLLKMSTVYDGYQYDLTYSLYRNIPLVTRQLSMRNVTNQVRILRNANCVLPSFHVGPSPRIVFPGSLPVGDISPDTFVEGEAFSPQCDWAWIKSQEPLVVIWDAKSKRGVGTWYYSEEEYAPAAIKHVGNAIAISHNQQIITKLKPNESVKLGKQYVWLARGSRDAAISGVQDVYRLIGLKAPDHAIDNLRDKIIYCAHPGGAIETQFSEKGGFNAFADHIPALRKMGVNLLWFLPVWEHPDAPITIYEPFDHFKIHAAYGTADDFKALSGRLKENGIDLLVDLVPHGPIDSSKLAKEHPEWIIHLEDGKYMYAWGQLAYDYANLGWQDYMRRVAQWDAKEFGAVGARIDCGFGSFPNWDPDISYRPSYSTLGGGLGMCCAIRDGFLKVNNKALVMPEEWTSANIFYRVSDLTYDAQLYFLMAILQKNDASPEEWASQIQQFLHDQQLALPPGALKMRWISNHDTVWGMFQKKRPLKIYGLDRMRALMALCAFIDGVPMTYQGDDDSAFYGDKENVSNVDYLARIWSIRKDIGAIRSGRIDYKSVRASDGVFACLWTSDKGKALVLISFNPCSVSSKLLLPASVSGEWTDKLSGDKMHINSEVSVGMAAHQVRVFVQEMN